MDSRSHTDEEGAYVKVFLVMMAKNCENVMEVNKLKVDERIRRRSKKVLGRGVKRGTPKSR